jgi:adenine phosphoribosyltransferase
LIPDEDNWLLFKKEDFNSFLNGIINLKSAYSLKPHLTVYDGLKIDYFRIGEEEIKKLKCKNNFFGVKKNEKNISGKPVFERLHEYFRNQLKGESGSIVGYGDLRDWVRIDLEFEPTVRFLDFERLYFRPYGLSWIREQIRKQVSTVNFHSVVGIESRGFVFMSDITSLSENSDCGAGMVKIRKKGKLSGEVITESYSLEYGSNIVEMQTSLAGGDRPFSDIKVIILDDVLATGGTMNAAVKLVERLGGDVVLISCIVELPELGGRNMVKNETKKNNYNIKTIFQYSLKDNRLYYSKS